MTMPNTSGIFSRALGMGEGLVSFQEGHATCDVRERHHDFSTCDRRMSHVGSARRMSVGSRLASARSCQTLHVADTRAAVASARHQTEITKLPYGGRR